MFIDILLVNYIYHHIYFITYIYMYFYLYKWKYVQIYINKSKKSLWPILISYSDFNFIQDFQNQTMTNYHLDHFPL